MREIAGIMASIVAFLGLAAFCIKSHIPQQSTAVPSALPALEDQLAPPPTIVPAPFAPPPAALPIEPFPIEPQEPAAVVAAPSAIVSSQVQPSSQPEPLSSQTITFSRDNDKISSHVRRTLDTTVAFLKDNPSSRIVIIGHADNSGPEPYNIDLSRRRAETVKLYLMRRGISARRLTTDGVGSSRPIADNSTPDGRQQNRRAELIIYPPNTGN